MQYCLEACDEVLCLLHREAEWWEKTDDVGARASCKTMLLLDEACAWLLVWDVKFNANHESLSANVNNVWEVASLHLCCECVNEVLANVGCILNKFLVLNDVEYSEGASTAEVVAAECCAKLTIDRSELRRNKHTTHWETVADALCHCNHVWLNTEVLMSEELTRTTVTALDLVADENCVVLVAESTNALKEFCTDHADAAYALDALDDDCTDIAFLNLFLPCCEIVEREIGDMTICVDWCDDLWVGSSLNGKRSTAMECLLK